MDQDTLIQRLMATFLAELEEHVRELNRDLLALEKEEAPSARADLVTALFRSAHSLKGAARSVNVTVVEKACHELETILAAARDGAQVLGPDILSVLFEAADAIEDAGKRLREKEPLEAAPLAKLLPRLRIASKGGASGNQEKEKAEEKALEAGAPQGPAPPQDTGPERLAGPPPGPIAGREGFVRIPASKLDALLTKGGELLVARRRGDATGEAVTTLQELVSGWRDELERGLVRRRQERLPESVESHLDGSRDRLRRLSRDLDQLAGRLAADRLALEQAAIPLEEDARRLRMRPFSEACEGLDRMVRDLAMEGRKEVTLVLEGGDVEMDRAILDGLSDPLRHLVRNALDHGIEPPAARRTAGKPERGRVTVSAALRGGGVEAAVEDDGRGVDLAAIREQARKKKIAEPEDERDLAKLIFAPGFTTARIITGVSGRGIGLDVVRSRVDALHGSVGFSFEPGHGCRFVLSLPLTLTTLRALFVEAGGQIYALPAASVRQLARVLPSEIDSVEGREVLKLGGAPVPLVSLAGLLGGREAPVRPAGWKMPAVVLGSGPERTAFAVDELLFEQEVVVKSLGPRLHVRGVAGATVLPTGRLSLILSASSLIASARSRAADAPALREALASIRTPERRRRLLVAEDSVTTRTLVKSILEAENFEVTVAVDGLEAWHLLQDQGADLVVSDIDMPRMDGFTLTEAIRGSKRLRDVPIVLVTALESDKDKERGLSVGADAYLLKSAFDQRVLLETIRQLL
jgi:two-component system chemotaxis sensor kinase CheA